MISVIIPLHESQSTIATCLRSIISQTHTDLEIICVDNLSMDNTLDIVKPFAKNDTRIKIVHNERDTGYSAAVNEGLNLARGEYVLIVEPNECLLPDMVHKALRHIEETHADLVYGDVAIENECGDSEPCKPYYDPAFAEIPELDPHQDFECLVQVRPTMCGKLFKKSVIDAHHLRFPQTETGYCAFFYEYLFAAKKAAYLPERLSMRRREAVKEISPHVFELFSCLDSINGIFDKHLPAAIAKKAMVRIAIRLMGDRLQCYTCGSRRLRRHFIQTARQYLTKWTRKERLAYKDAYIPEEELLLCPSIEWCIRKHFIKMRRFSHANTLSPPAEEQTQQTSKYGKYLIFGDWYINMRSGGPPGYLANLRYGLNRIDTPGLHRFELCTWGQSPAKPWKKKKGFFSNLLKNNYFLKRVVTRNSPKQRKRLQDRLEELKRVGSMRFPQSFVQKIRSEGIRYVHCHNIMDAIKVINTLRAEGMKHVKVILTTHSPESPAQEEANLILEEGYSTQQALPFLKELEKLQEFAFTQSDILLFPTREAMEPYFDTIPQFREWVKDKDVRFLETGARQLVSSKSAAELRKMYGIPTGKKVVVYIGRHVKVKGYPTLVQAGQELLKQRTDTFFLIGGKTNAMYPPPKMKDWKELGWVNPADLLRVADVFVLPNLRTYFDLILLEVMSTGTPIIASNMVAINQFKPGPKS